jgi:hypothetical protein
MIVQRINELLEQWDIYNAFFCCTIAPGKYREQDPEETGTNMPVSQSNANMHTRKNARTVTRLTCSFRSLSSDCSLGSLCVPY